MSRLRKANIVLATLLSSKVLGFQPLRHSSCRLAKPFSHGHYSQVLFLSTTKHGGQGEEIVTGGSSAVKSQLPLPSCAEELQMLSFYHFGEIQDDLLFEIRDNLFESLRTIPGLRGTIYLAHEGVNAQLAVPPGKELDLLLNTCSTILPFDPFAVDGPNLGDIVKIDHPTFVKFILRIRDKILRDGLSSSVDWSDAGEEISPSDWHEQIKKEGIVLLDCRNSYESDEGIFTGATPLGTNTFQGSWEKLDEIADEIPRDTHIFMYCTGGVRKIVFNSCKFVRINGKFFFECLFIELLFVTLSHTNAFPSSSSFS